MSWRERVGRGSLAGARWSLYASVFAPLVYTTDAIYPFVTPAALWFRLTVAAAGTMAAIAVLTGTVRGRPSRDPVAGAMALYLLAAVAAALAGEAPMHSLFGDFQRMGGAVAWAHYLVFYLLLRAVLDRRGWTRFLWLLAGSTAVVAGIGALQAWDVTSGWHPLFAVERPQATLGNPGYLSIYLLFGMAACGLLARRVTTVAERVLLSAVVLLEGTVLMLSTIRTTLVAVLAAGLAGAAVLVLAADSRRIRRWSAALAFGFAAAAVGLWLARDSALLRSVPTVQEAAGTAFEEPGVQERLTAWEAAVAGIGRAPLLGAGPENYRLVWDRHFSPRLYELPEHTPPYLTEVHDAYLEAAAEAGLIGGLAFLLFWIAVGRQVWRAARGGLDPPEAALLAAAFAACAIFLLLWFRTPSTFPAFVALVAFAGAALEGETGWLRPVGEALSARESDDGRGPDELRGPRGARAAAGAGLVLFLGAAFHTTALARPAHLLAEAAQGGSVEARVRGYEAAVAARVPGAEEVGEEYARFMAGLDPDALERTEGAERRALERGFIGAARALEAEIARDPFNARHRALAADLSFNRFHFDADSAHLERGIEAARRSVERSPPRMRYRRMLSDLLMIAGRPEEAMAVLREARGLLGDVGELHYSIAKIHTVEGRLEPAVRALRRADSLGYEPERSNRPVYADVARSLLAAGDTARAQRVLGMAGGRFNFGDDQDD